MLLNLCKGIQEKPTRKIYDNFPPPNGRAKNLKYRLLSIFMRSDESFGLSSSGWLTRPWHPIFPGLLLTGKVNLLQPFFIHIIYTLHDPGKIKSTMIENVVFFQQTCFFKFIVYNPFSYILCEIWLYFSSCKSHLYYSILYSFLEF